MTMQPTGLQPLYLRKQQINNSSRSMAIAFGYLVVLTAAELLTTLFAPQSSAMLYNFLVAQYVLLLVLLLVQTAVSRRRKEHRLWLALTIVPIIRITSFSLPLATFHLMYWYLITSVPVFIGAVLIMRQIGFSWRDVGVNGRNWRWQIPLFLSGLLIGYFEYFILQPRSLVGGLGWAHVVAAALILLISTGFLEELIFRRMLQQVAIDLWGRTFGIVYVAAIFGVLHIGYSSFVDVVFVFSVGLFFGWAADKTGSIVGVTLAHGLANIVLFLILPAAGVADNALIIPPDFWQALQEQGVWLLLLVGGFGLMRLLVIEPQLSD